MNVVLMETQTLQRGGRGRGLKATISVRASNEVNV